MASFLVAVQEEADVLSREWRARAGTDGKVSLDCYAEMRRLTLAVILRVTFGLGEIKGRYS